MNASAITLMVIAMVLVWGGLVAAIAYLRARPDVESWPPGGGDDDDRADDAPIQRDT